MPTPSLILVPARFKTGKLYTPVATTSGGLVLGASGDFNVTRATTATRVNASGFIEVVASGIPRLDYYTSGGTAGCPALLVEPSAQNLAKHSEQFDTVTSGWIAAGLQTITGNTNATLDPAGLNTADLIVATTGTLNHDIRPNADNLPAFVSGTTYTYSVFAKATSAVSGFLQIYFGAIGFSPASPFANFQLSGNGAITTGTYSAASIQPFGNGWYRCSITAIAAANGNGATPMQPILTSGVIRNGTFAGNGTDGVYLWGAQLVTGSIATSYIPTTTAPVTRNADVISVSGAVSGCIGQTEGTIYAEVDMRNAISRVASILQLRQDGNNEITFGITSAFGGTNTIAVRAQQAGSFVIGFYQQNNAAGIYKIAFAYKSTDCKLYINGTDTGVSISANNAFTAFSFNEIQLGMSNSVNQFNDRIRAAALYTTRLTDSELAALTTL